MSIVIKLSLAILSVLGDCLEKFICSSLPARLMEEFLASKEYLQPDLLGSFPADVCPDITGQFGSGHRANKYHIAGALDNKSP